MNEVQIRIFSYIFGIKWRLCRTYPMAPIFEGRTMGGHLESLIFDLEQKMTVF